MVQKKRIQKEDFRGKKITVMGIGQNKGGVGTIRFLSEAGANVIATDLKSKEELQESLKQLKGLSNVTYVLGQHRAEDFAKADMIVKNPSVPNNSQHIKTAIENNVPIETDIGIFFELCKGPILGVTGTKGKSTTTTLLYQMIKRKHKDAVLGGNIGTSPLLKLDKIKETTPVVLELSSWQLEGLKKHKKSPHIAVITNLYPDHLNRYRSIEEYYESKKIIFQFQSTSDTVVLNYDDSNIRAFAEEVQSNIVWFSRTKLGALNSCFLEGKLMMFRKEPENILSLASLENATLQGEHNISNMLAAAAAATVYGIPEKLIQKTLQETSSIEHRLERVAIKNDIEFINDTTATTPEALQAALMTIQKPIIAIVGGTDKELSFNSVGSVLLQKTKDIIFLKGSATEKLIDELKNIQKKQDLPKEVDFTTYSTLKEALEAAISRAVAGDAVVLSPGATSFQMFQNEFDRGNQFKELVQQL